MITRVGISLVAFGVFLGILVREQPQAVKPPPSTRGCADTVRLPTRTIIGDVDADGRIRLDPSRPVTPKADILAAWRQRQARITSFHFEWTEVQCHARGWLPNPRYAERERLSIPALRYDRTVTVAKTLTVAGNMMRYTFELDRGEEADGISVTSASGANDGLGARAHYSYVSVFDGRNGARRLTSLLDSPPPAVINSNSNFDAQNLDARPIMLAFRPLDPVMGHLLVDRAVTNLRRSFYQGRSTHLLEERHDPSTWKTILWIEPERDFLIPHIGVNFAQQRIVDMHIDYQHDARWGWIPSGWRTIEMLADGSRRLVSVATVSRYSINTPISADQFR